jgi:hypothetical protein
MGVVGADRRLIALAHGAAPFAVGGWMLKRIEKWMGDPSHPWVSN